MLDCDSIFEHLIEVGSTHIFEYIDHFLTMIYYEYVMNYTYSAEQLILEMSQQHD